MSEITRNQAIQIVEDIRTAISAGSVTNTLEAQVLEYCVVVLGRRIEETGQSGYIETLPDVVAFLAGFSSPTTLRSLLNAINGKIPAEASDSNKLADKAFVTNLTDALQTAVDTINEKIPAEASGDNNLADKAFVTDLTNALQTAVNIINDNIGNGYVYAGIATPSGTPVSGKVFYLARQAGQYTNFGGLTVTEGINILKRNGSAWTQEQLVSMADIRKNPLIGYYECDTAGDTAAKAVTAAGYVLPATGGSVKIKMANRNTVANATLNINSTGAKPLYYNGQRAGVGNTWNTNEIIEVFYDGANYQAYNVAGSNGDGVFDISAYNLTDGKPTPYEDLEAALGPDGEHVPQSLHKGGMSVKFIQGNDSKYIRYNLIADEFTTDVTKWAIDDAGVYVDNPEFVYVKTDAEGKILWAIKTDGGIYYGTGVPQQVIDYIEEKIAELSLDEYEDIVAFLNDLEKGDKTLQDLLNEKVDKEEGKSLIDEEYASTKSTVYNPEFLDVTTDSEDKVLEGIQEDGTKVIGGDLTVGGSTKILGNMEISGISYKVIESPEYLASWVDTEDKVIFGLKTDGKTYVGDADFLNEIKNNQEAINEIKSYLANFDNLDIDALSSIAAVDNPEFIEAKTDSEGKLLAGRTSDGAAFENVGFSTPKVSIDGHTIENVEDPEGRTEMLTDSEGKIVSYRDAGGVKHENVGIELGAEALKSFKEMLNIVCDWSDKDSIYIPEPRLAHLNIITNFNLTTLSKTSDVPVTVEFYDGAGNYFKKYGILNGQGRSSLSFVKKGLGMDFFNENPTDANFDEDNTFKMRFGDWIYQDSFHIKSYYTDWSRCTSPVVYKLTDEVVRTRGVMNDRPYKKYYVGEYSDAANANTQSKLDQNMETGARCFPDGFPVIVYQNGEFWGVNAWQLKKSRDNYMLDKKKATHIHLDGDMGTSHWSEVTPPQPTPWVPFWLWNGTINWEVYCSGNAGIETRNPKNLYCVNGKKYNADTNDAEIITTEIAGDWIEEGKIIPTGKSIESIAREELADDGITDPTAEQLEEAISKVEGYFTTTGKVRKSIEDLTTYIPTIRQMATIETSNGDIMIGAFGGTYEVSKNFGKGVWVKAEGRNYMSIHSSNTGNPVTDTNNWVDITDALADVKETIEDMFDLDTFIDFIVIGNVCGNNDAWDNNGQIVTWGKLEGSDRLNWSVNMYDCDITFGCQWNGLVASAANNDKLGSNYPLYSIFWNYYFEELKERYHELRDKGIFDADHITQLFRSWMDRVGYDNYKKEYKKWNESPCFRDGSKTYAYYPTTGGFYGSIERIYLWVKKRIQYMDAADFFDYNQN